MTLLSAPAINFNNKLSQFQARHRHMFHVPKCFGRRSKTKRSFEAVNYSALENVSSFADDTPINLAVPQNRSRALRPSVKIANAWCHCWEWVGGFIRSPKTITQADLFLVNSFSLKEPCAALRSREHRFSLNEEQFSRLCFSLHTVKGTRILFLRTRGMWDLCNH